MRRLRILLSYHYFRNVDLDALFAKYFTEPYPETFADSGAFSAMTQGFSIDVHAYAEWLLRFRHLFAVYANLDVIKDAAGTLANQQVLEEDYGLAPLPVFHVAEPWEYLAGYLDRYPYLALGVAGTPSRTYWPWLIRCFQAGKGKAVFHGFGITTWTVMRRLPWFSVDSSSWGSGFRYGLVPLFDPSRGGFVDVKLGDPRSCFARAPLIRALGFDPADFADRARYSRAKTCAISALSYLQAEEYLRGIHGEIQIPEREPGFKLHLAVASGEGDRNMALPNLAGGLRLYLADTNSGNFRSAQAGLRLYLSDPNGAKDVVLAQEGLRAAAID